MKRRPPSLASARTAMVLNQFATPGLGSILAGRYVAGAGQLLLAVAGVGLILAWFVLVLKAAYTIMESSGEPHPPHFLGWLGLGAFLVAWIWAWFTSVSVLRQARRASDDRWSPPAPSAGPPAY